MKLPQLFFLLIAGFLLAANLPSADVKLDVVQEQSLEGTWKVVAVEQGGKKDVGDFFKDLQFVITRNKLTIKDGADVRGSATIKLDKFHNPNRIDLRMEQDPKGKTYLAIYVLQGNQLKLCLHEVGGGRPTAFVTKAGSDAILFIMTKARP